MRAIIYDGMLWYTVSHLADVSSSAQLANEDLPTTTFALSCADLKDTVHLKLKINPLATNYYVDRGFGDIF